MFFRGAVEHQLDDKNRMRIPSKFKKGLTGEHGEKTYSFMLGHNRCICVMEDEALDEAIASLADEGISESSQDSTAVLSSIFPAEEDAQGRVMLPTLLKKIAGIKKEIVTVGHGNRLEIWAADRYQEYMQNVDYDAALKRLGL